MGMTLEMSSSDNQDKKDILRIKTGKIEAKLNILTGKQGVHFLTYCPSLRISGYGNTEKEAVDFIKEEMEVFCEDLFSMNNTEREKFILSLGFTREKFHNKNFSKTYIDENGRLQDFDEGTVKREILETV